MNILPPILISSLIALATAANATLLVYEPFDYSSGNLNGSGNATGIDGSWNVSGSNVFSVLSPGLTFTTLPVDGNRAGRSTSSNYSWADANTTTAATNALTADNSTIWFSVLWQPGASGTSERGAFVFGNSSFVNDNDARVDGDAYGFSPYNGSRQSTIFANGYVAGGSNTPSASDNTGIAQAGGTTLLLVGKINWMESGTNDEFYLFNVNDPSAGEPSEGSAVASVTSLDFDQSSWNTIAFYENNSGNFDEIRFGTTYADVVGVVPEPAHFALIATGTIALFVYRRRKLSR